MKNLLIGLSFCLIGLNFITSAHAQEWQYKVQKGDSLYTIAQENLIDDSYFTKLKTYNSINLSLKLQPGRILKAPISWVSNFPSFGELLVVNGDVSVISNNIRTKAQAGQRLNLEEELQTSQNSTAVLGFANKSTVSIGQLTTLSIISASQTQDGSVVKARISIKRGDIEVFSNPDKRRGNRLEIESPAAISAVRGTRFRVRVDSSTAETATEVLIGNVKVTGSNDTKDLTEKEGTITAVGQSPLDPVKLLLQPDIHQIETIYNDFGTITWDPLKGAVNYRLQVYGDKEFNSLIYDKTIVNTSVDDIFFVADGEYYLKLRGVDINGIEGMDKVLSFNVNARPKPPFVSSPQADTTTVITTPGFIWSMPTEADHFHLQLASDKDLKDLLIDEILEVSSQYTLGQELAPGKYYWRVASISDDDQGPFTELTRLTIESMPEFSFAPISTDSSSKFEITLGSESKNIRYHIQVARDLNFTKLIYSDWVEENKFEFDANQAGSYFFRLGVYDEMTDKIQYSDIQKVIKPFTGWKLVLTTLALGLLIAL